MEPRCCAIRSNGSRCRAWPVDGSQYCLAHDAARTEQMREARRRGGRNAHPQIPSNLPDVVLDTSEHACALIRDTIDQLRRGQISEKRATTVAYLLNVWRQQRASAELEQRFEELERAVLAKRGDHKDGGQEP